MKGLLVFLLVLGGVWLWRSRQSQQGKVQPPKAPEAQKPQDMVRCGHCGLHIPGREAVDGINGVYCSLDHQRLSES